MCDSIETSAVDVVTFISAIKSGYHLLQCNSISIAFVFFFFLLNSIDKILFAELNEFQVLHIEWLEQLVETIRWCEWIFFSERLSRKIIYFFENLAHVISSLQYQHICQITLKWKSKCNVESIQQLYTTAIVRDWCNASFRCCFCCVVCCACETVYSISFICGQLQLTLDRDVVPIL